MKGTIGYNNHILYSRIMYNRKYYQVILFRIINN